MQLKKTAATLVLSVKMWLKARSSLSSLAFRKILHLSLVVRSCLRSFSALDQQADVNEAAVGCRFLSTQTVSTADAWLQQQPCQFEGAATYVRLITDKRGEVVWIPPGTTPKLPNGAFISIGWRRRPSSSQPWPVLQKHYWEHFLFELTLVR